MVNKVIHFEFDSENIDETIHFYSNIFGWKFTKEEGEYEYWSIETGEKAMPGIGGGLMKRDDNHMPSMYNVIEVDDIDRIISMIIDNGGEITQEKKMIDKVGWIAYFEDTQGNVFGIMQSEMS